MVQSYWDDIKSWGRGQMISRDFGSDIVELPWVRPGQSPQRRGLVFFMVFQKSGMPFVSISSLLLLAFVWLFMPSLCLPENPCQVSSVQSWERRERAMTSMGWNTAWKEIGPYQVSSLAALLSLLDHQTKYIHGYPNLKRLIVGDRISQYVVVLLSNNDRHRH